MLEAPFGKEHQVLSAQGNVVKWDTPAEAAFKDTKEGKREAKDHAYEKSPEGKADKSKQDAEKEKKHPQPERHAKDY